jgi:hypothetical protein
MNPQDSLLNHPLFALSPEVPSEADASSARTQIKFGETELHRLDFEPLLLLTKGAQVISRLGRCRIVVAPYKSFLSVPEIDTIPESYGKSHPHLQKTQICASWRTVAFNEPTLWKMIFSYPRNSSIGLAAA